MQPPPAPPPQQVQLIPVIKGGSFDSWQMSMNGGPAQGPPYPDIPVAAGSSGVVVFTIRSNPGSNITFGTAPISIQAGSGKPNSGVDAQFVPTVNPSTVLTLTDTNQTKGPYGYVLNFNNAKQLDPIIDNGGGGPGKMNYDAIWYAVGALALLIVIALVLRPMFRKPGPVERPRQDL